MYKIISKKRLNNLVDQMVIDAPLVAMNAKPGHFVIIRVNESGERVPLTIVDINGNHVRIIYQKLGYSTKLLGNKEVGEYISDFVGPLGKAAHIRKSKKLLAIAGGVGAAPLLPQVKAYYNQGTEVDLIIGAKSKEYLLLSDEYQKYCKNIYFCTDDGSFGEKGFVTLIADRIIPMNSYDHCVVIGPLIMMKYCVDITKKYSLSTDVSLNPIMIDGTGMCGNCRVSIKGKTFFACVDGPDFLADGIDFNELMARQDYYKDEESHICNLEGTINETK